MPTKNQPAWGARWSGKPVSASMWSGTGKRWGKHFRRFEDSKELNIWYGLMDQKGKHKYGSYRIRLRGDAVTISHLAPSPAKARRIAEIRLPPNKSRVLS